MAQSNNLVAAALNKAGITKGPNDNRGVVGRVAGGGGAGGIGASSRISGMDIDRDGPGGGRPGRGRKVSVELGRSAPFHVQAWMDGAALLSHYKGLDLQLPSLHNQNLNH